MNPLLAIGLILAAVFGLSKRKQAPGSDPGGNTATDVAPEGEALTTQLRAAFNRVITDFGVPVAENVERIYRLETDGFTSGQFRRTNTAGMHAFKATFPFGWSLGADGLSASDFLPTIAMKENASGTYQWVVFKDLGQAIHYLGYFLNKFENNPGRWKTTDPAKQAPYKAAVAGIDPAIVRSLTRGI